MSSAWIALVAACAPQPVHDSDAGASGDADARDAPTASVCVRDAQCDDGLFCNGLERCAPLDPHASASGCLAGSVACTTEQSCDETFDLCLPAGCEHADADGDGVRSLACLGIDCDDQDRDRFPGHPEVCDALQHDEDCDPCTIASSAGEGDLDADGFLSVACANAFVGAPPTCDPLTTRIDAMRVTGLDCEDMNASVHPSQIESCNLRDDDCDGAIDEGVLRSFYPDGDRDGYGAQGSTALAACGPPSETVEDATDCDDAHAAVNPGARETCNGIDDDCDGTIDEGATAPFFYADADGDGFGDPTAPQPGMACAPPSGLVANADDCDDARATTHPGAPETCDRRDDDCSLPFPGTGGVDPSEDADGDGHAPIGAACVGGDPIDDCDDADPRRFPGAVEHCDLVDEDCDGSVDEGADTACVAPWTCMAGVCTDALGVAVGSGHVCAIRADRSAACWGWNNYGQLGDGTQIDALAPTPVVGLADVVQIVAGSSFTCARLAAGTVACWGDNGSRQIGDGTNLMRTTPVPVVGLSGIVDITAGGNHACALEASGTAWCWGANGVTTPDIGNGTYAGVIPTPNPVLNLDDAVEIEAGPSTTCARRRSGSVVCWGANWNGQLGDGTTTASPVPIAVVGVTDAVEIDLAAQFSCARRATGQLACWGNLGGLTSWLGAITDAVEIAAGGDSICVRHASGTVECNGTVAGDSSSIVGAVRIDANAGDACVRRASGELLCWGDDYFGQIGDGLTMTTTLTPFSVPGLP